MAEPTGLAQYITNTREVLNKEPVVRGLVNAISNNPVINGIGKVVNNPYFQRSMSDIAPIASMLVAPEFLVAKYGVPAARGLAGLGSYTQERLEDTIANSVNNPYVNAGLAIQDSLENSRKIKNALRFLP